MNAATNLLLKHPVFFDRNRVFRVYQGGKLFHSFFGDEPVDGNLPEEWIASKVKALNRVPSGKNEGLSFVEGQSTSFASLLADHPDEMTGGKGFDILVKILDSAVRLPAQTHPDKPFSRQYFHSEYGKTESWLILDTRPDASIYYGFKEGVTRKDLECAVKRSEEKGDAFSDLMQRIPARVGDVWFIPARVAHAIGAGCLLLEVQEPTDFTIQPERWCDDYRLSDSEMYLGLDPATALDCFDLSRTGGDVVKQGLKSPTIIDKSPCHLKEALITYEDTPCFAMNRISVHGGACSISGPAVFVVTDGAGIIKGDQYSRSLKKGDYFFMPLAAGSISLHADEGIQVVECLPPVS